jgi:hypothetical protein
MPAIAVVTYTSVITPVAIAIVQSAKASTKRLGLFSRKTNYCQ